MKSETPHELIQNHYPTAAQAVDSLVELGKHNPHLLESIIELAMVIGIHASFRRMETDSRADKERLVRDLMHHEW